MFASTMARFSGVTALGAALSLTTLTSTTSAEPAATATAAPTLYLPPPPQSTVYHPTPGRPYVPSYASAFPVSSASDDRPIVTETEDFLSRRDVRLLTLAVFSMIILLTGAAILGTIHKHKDEVDRGGK